MNFKRRQLDELIARRANFIPMPEWIWIRFHNGTHERCDMAQGPCACGAWHKIDDWPFDVRVAARVQVRRHQ